MLYCWQQKATLFLPSWLFCRWSLSTSLISYSRRENSTIFLTSCLVKQFWEVANVVVIAYLIRLCYFERPWHEDIDKQDKLSISRAFLNLVWIEEKVKFFGKKAYCYCSCFKWLSINWEPRNLERKKNKQKKQLKQVLIGFKDVLRETQPQILYNNYYSNLWHSVSICRKG